MFSQQLDKIDSIWRTFRIKMKWSYKRAYNDRDISYLIQKICHHFLEEMYTPHSTIENQME